MGQYTQPKIPEYLNPRLKAKLNALIPLIQEERNTIQKYKSQGVEIWDPVINYIDLLIELSKLCNKTEKSASSFMTKLPYDKYEPLAFPEDEGKFRESYSALNETEKIQLLIQGLSNPFNENAGLAKCKKLYEEAVNYCPDPSIVDSIKQKVRIMENLLGELYKIEIPKIKVKDPKIADLHYQHATWDHGRNHENEVTTEFSSDAFKSEYQGLKGDALKTKILLKFRESLRESLDLALQNQDSKCLERTIHQIRADSGYKILEQRQGARWLNYIPGLKTDSILALETMIKEAEADLTSGLASKNKSKGF